MYVPSMLFSPGSPSIYSLCPRYMIDRAFRNHENFFRLDGRCWFPCFFSLHALPQFQTQCADFEKLKRYNVIFLSHF